MPGWLAPVEGLLGRVTPLLLAEVTESDCERYGDGFLGQPANAATSLAFVVAGAALLARRDGEAPPRVFAGLVVATGVGSLVQHGPAPAWADLAHDLPLVALLAYVAADAASDLRGRRVPAAWWVVPALVVGPLGAVARDAGTLAQGLLAAVAVVLSLQRARVRPGLRRRLLDATVLLGLGALVGTLSRTGWPLCRPDGLLQGHAFWHVMAAAALWRLAPVVGRSGAVTGSRPARRA